MDMAADLAELADEMAPKGFRIVYENWSWATHTQTWKDVWEIVWKADRPNLGLCLDTFQSAGGEWGRPDHGLWHPGGQAQGPAGPRLEGQLRRARAHGAA